MTNLLALEEPAPTVPLGECERLGFQLLDAGRFGEAESLLRVAHGAKAPGGDITDLVGAWP